MSDGNGYIIKSGQYVGMSIQRVPTRYLTWMVNANHAEVGAAKMELERRKNEIDEIEILPIAVDRASTGCLRVWERTRHSREGLHSWLSRMARGALSNGVDKQGRIAYGGVLFDFDRNGPWPVLKTVSVEKLVGMN